MQDRVIVFCRRLEIWRSSASVVVMVRVESPPPATHEELLPRSTQRPQLLIVRQKNLWPSSNGNFKDLSKFEFVSTGPSIRFQP